MHTDPCWALAVEIRYSLSNCQTSTGTRHQAPTSLANPPDASSHCDWLLPSPLLWLWPSKLTYEPNRHIFIGCLRDTWRLLTDALWLRCSQRRIQLSSLQRKTTPFITSFSLSISPHLSLCVWAHMLCCYVSVFVPLKVLKLLQVLWMPGSDQITYSEIIEQQKLISDPDRNKIFPKDVIYPDWSPYTAVLFLLWLGIIFTSISSHIGPTHPLQLVDSEQDRASHGAINIYSVHSSSSYCSVVWRGRIIFAQKVYVVISCHCQHWTNALLLPEVPHREGYIIFSLTFIAFLF